MWVIPYLAIIVGIIALDQISKVLVCAFLYGEQLSLIPGILRFSYVENTGMAFGMLANHRWIFMLLSVIGIAAVAFYLYRYQKTTVGRIALSMIIGGGIGNMIDRIFRGFVVDFIDFCAFPTLWAWVFNIADSCVCVGAGLMALWMILDMIRESKEEKAKKASASTAEKTEGESGDGNE